jgi:hypothetical protein
MTKQISPLRQRMIDDMAFRNMSPNTQKVDAYAVANFVRFHRQSPDKLGLAQDKPLCPASILAETLVDLTRDDAAEMLPLVGSNDMRLPDELSAGSNIPNAKIDPQPIHRNGSDTSDHKDTNMIWLPDRKMRNGIDAERPVVDIVCVDRIPTACPAARAVAVNPLDQRPMLAVGDVAETPAARKRLAAASRASGQSQDVGPCLGWSTATDGHRKPPDRPVATSRRLVMAPAATAPWRRSPLRCGRGQTAAGTARRRASARRDRGSAGSTGRRERERGIPGADIEHHAERRAVIHVEVGFAAPRHDGAGLAAGYPAGHVERQAIGRAQICRQRVFEIDRMQPVPAPCGPIRPEALLQIVGGAAERCEHEGIARRRRIGAEAAVGMLEQIDDECGVHEIISSGVRQRPIDD